MKKLIILLVSVSFTSIGHCAPAPSGASASIITGDSITISGYSFGLKPTAAPIRFDQFDGGTAGSVLGSPWQSRDGGSSYMSGDSHSGSMSAGRVVLTGEMFNSSYLSFAGVDEVFYSYWLKIDRLSEDDNPNIKLGRISSTATNIDPYMGEGTISLTSYSYNGGDPKPYLCYWQDGTGEYSPWSSQGDGWDKVDVPANAWARVDCRGKVSIPAGTANGVVECTTLYPGNYNDYLGGSNLVNRQSGRSWQYESILLPAMEGSTSTHDYDIYVDDVYVDSTPARVEVCKEPTWTTRKHCEIQPATEWGDTSITISANTGTLSSGTNYLYVVDSTNSVNANGVAVVVGDSVVVDGACGPANGGSFSEAPTTNLCTSGTESAVLGTGPWSWTCAGLNGGDNSGTCSASLSSGPSGTGMRISAGASTRIGTGSMPITIQ